MVSLLVDVRGLLHVLVLHGSLRLLRRLLSRRCSLLGTRVLHRLVTGVRRSLVALVRRCLEELRMPHLLRRNLLQWSHLHLLVKQLGRQLLLAGRSKLGVVRGDLGVVLCLFLRQRCAVRAKQGVRHYLPVRPELRLHVLRHSDLQETRSNEQTSQRSRKAATVPSRNQGRAVYMDLTSELRHGLRWQVLRTDNALPLQVAPLIFQIHLHAKGVLVGSGAWQRSAFTAAAGADGR